jgi:hypothetical protein
MAVRFSPDGRSLYVVDIGLLGADVATPIPYAENRCSLAGCKKIITGF